MTPHSAQACARAGIPYTPEWRERVEGRLSNMEIETRFARRQCALCEPEHAAVERALHRGSREKGLVRVGTAEYSEAWWKHEWRSMPDYDGGGNAPSGPRFYFQSTDNWYGEPDVSPRLLCELLDWRLDTDDEERGELRALFVTADECEEQPWGHWDYEEGEDEGPPFDRLFAAPSEGGRGWCPERAGIEWPPRSR